MPNYMLNDSDVNAMRDIRNRVMGKRDSGRVDRHRPEYDEPFISKPFIVSYLHDTDGYVLQIAPGIIINNFSCADSIEMRSYGAPQEKIIYFGASNWFGSGRNFPLYNMTIAAGDYFLALAGYDDGTGVKAFLRTAESDYNNNGFGRVVRVAGYWEYPLAKLTFVDATPYPTSIVQIHQAGNIILPTVYSGPLAPVFGYYQVPHDNTQILTGSPIIGAQYKVRVFYNNVEYTKSSYVTGIAFHRRREDLTRTAAEEIVGIGFTNGMPSLQAETYYYNGIFSISKWGVKQLRTGELTTVYQEV